MLWGYRFSTVNTASALVYPLDRQALPLKFGTEMRVIEPRDGCYLCTLIRRRGCRAHDQDVPRADLFWPHMRGRRISQRALEIEGSMQRGSTLPPKLADLIDAACAYDNSSLSLRKRYCF